MKELESKRTTESSGRPDLRRPDHSPKTPTIALQAPIKSAPNISIDSSASENVALQPLQHGFSPRQAQPLGHPKVTAREFSTSFHPNADISDALTTVPSTEEDSNYLFGGSSSIAFVRSLRELLIQDNVRGQHPTLQGDEGREPLRQFEATPEIHTVHNWDSNTFALPTRRVADNYMKCFWKYMHPLFPILHKPTCIATYEMLWAPENERDSNQHSSHHEDQLFLATLNIIFAIGCQFSDMVAADRRTQVADQFYQQSRTLVAVDALDSVSLSVVQMLLLTAVYLQSTKYANRCWSTVGLAIRNAQSLGLHVENLRNTSHNQIRQETRRKVWYVCIMLDTYVFQSFQCPKCKSRLKTFHFRLLASTFGRPKMISCFSNVPLPLCIDDEYLLEDGEGCQPGNQLSYLGLFVSSIKLFEIITDILSQFYHQKEGGISHEDGSIEWWSHNRLDDVLKINTALDNFLKTLPPQLQFQGHLGDNFEGEQSSWQSIQAKVLHCRYVYPTVCY